LSATVSPTSAARRDNVAKASIQLRGRVAEGADSTSWTGRAIIMRRMFWYVLINVRLKMNHASLLLT